MNKELVIKTIKRQILLKVFADLGLSKVTAPLNIRESFEFARLLRAIL
jgi:hypothetical protein